MININQKALIKENSKMYMRGLAKKSLCWVSAVVIAFSFSMADIRAVEHDGITLNMASPDVTTEDETLARRNEAELGERLQATEGEPPPHLPPPPQRQQFQAAEVEQQLLKVAETEKLSQRDTAKPKERRQKSESAKMSRIDDIKVQWQAAEVEQQLQQFQAAEVEQQRKFVETEDLSWLQKGEYDELMPLDEVKDLSRLQKVEHKERQPSAEAKKQRLAAEAEEQLQPDAEENSFFLTYAAAAVQPFSEKAITFKASSPDGILTQLDVHQQIAAAEVEPGDTFSASFDSTVLRIGDSAFLGCGNLTSAVIGNSVISIGKQVFEECTNLTNIVIGNSVESIGHSAFYGCTNLDNLIIPDSVTIISDWTFGYCSNLTSVIIPNSVELIGESAFYYCNKLLNIEFPDSLLIIWDWAFGYCTNLASVVIPANVSYIGIQAFDFCFNLSIVYFDGDAPEVRPFAFDEVPDGAVAYVYSSAKGFPPEGQLWNKLIVKYRDG